MKALVWPVDYWYEFRISDVAPVIEVWRGDDHCELIARYDPNIQLHPGRAQDATTVLVEFWIADFTTQVGRMFANGDLEFQGERVSTVYWDENDNLRTNPQGQGLYVLLDELLTDNASELQRFISTGAAHIAGLLAVTHAA